MSQPRTPEEVYSMIDLESIENGTIDNWKCDFFGFVERRFAECKSQFPFMGNQKPIHMATYNCSRDTRLQTAGAEAMWKLPDSGFWDV